MTGPHSDERDGGNSMSDDDARPPIPDPYPAGS